MAEKTEYDLIIVGGGHNGLTCGALLARAGLDVLVLERRHNIGGGSTHPCGGVTGAPGFNAAGVIADDVGVKRWWLRA